jgi:uncharacterized protein with FMN-binding domain
MRRVLIAIFGTALGTALLVGAKALGPAPQPAVATAPLENGPSTSASHPPSPKPSQTTTSKATTKPKPRTIKGDAFPAAGFGDVQLRIVVTGQHVDDVQVVQMSNRPLNAPQRLRQEALAAQSARLTIVSGATYTSRAYMRSLQSALDQR